MLPDEIRRQVVELAPEYGVPEVWITSINSAAFWERSTINRTQEVCMVVRRPNGRILIFRKTFYPPGVYRLMTGGVELGESILAALHREILEETGLEVKVRRLLAIAGYRPEGVFDGEPRFWTFAFLLDETGGTLGALDPDERVADFQEIEPAALWSIADSLERLPDGHSEELEEQWAPWGRFRAFVHRIVHKTLQFP